MNARIVALTLAASFSLLPVASARQTVAGAVYTMTNAAQGNEVLVFARAADGSLHSARAFDTDGLGTGDSLGNQGALALSPDHRWLYAVNAGSHELSVFTVTRTGLMLIQVVPSGGLRPISLALDRRLLYVLNAGGSAGGQDNIAGFQVGSDGKLTSIPGSVLPLSAASTGPAQVGFAPAGGVLVVTEKDTNRIDTYLVGADGLANGPQVFDSAAPTPFGFAFGVRGQLFVSEAAGGAVDASSLSSYAVTASGDLEVISAAVPTTETAACWALVTPDGGFAYTTNTGSGTISGFRINFEGELRLLDRDGRTALTGKGSMPIDLALSSDGRYLYSLDSGTGQISAFSLRSDGRLTPLRGARSLPDGANGLAAR